MNQEEIIFSLENYLIRQLNDSEFLLYKQMRLEALKTEPAMFRITHPSETKLTDEEWLARIKEPRAVFGLYLMDELVGMTSIVLLNDAEAYLGQSYIKREHRGKGLSALFYKSRIAWALKKQLKKLSISHRESNIASKMANQKFGFHYTHTEPCNWQDGQSENVLYYELKL
ncbi:GNAT family N-acetyltransferase [Chryseobacterium sp. LAM-KRS1]|uniref:GNAT family N-acetyltransferase n=1 Tax=Chryseobacterium sp. LAM-KRS1 TaxID=2715754 RepID=UPI001556EDA9|nr:GNAT family N-acetyltransferase [Chryseobacterium sp. LAM-KRS1]